MSLSKPVPTRQSQFSTDCFSLAALTVLELPAPAMIHVAAAAGYQGVGLRLIPATPEEVHYSLLSDAPLRAQTLAALRETGIRVIDIEILRLKPETQVNNDFTQVLDVGAELGASEVLVAGNDSDHNGTADNFAALCELASVYGMHPHLEFMPWTGVKNLPQAKTIVQQVRHAGHNNACLLIDPFHFNRSRSTLDDLAEIPPEWMRYAQLCDVKGEPPASMDEIIREARFERCFPGDGDIDLKALLNTLPPSVPLSLEIPTDNLRQQGVTAQQRAELALSKTKSLLGL